MKQRMIALAALATALSNAGAQEIPPPPVEAPAGFRWVLNDPYSDEFNGTELDQEKWHDHYPGWEGRVPGKFVPSAVSMKDGCLRITSSVLNPPQGVSNEWWIACGAIQSKAQEARYGYYEARMKASGISTSSTFWLMNPRDKKARPSKSTELDIQECIGNAQRWPDFAFQMKSNTHVNLYPADPAAEPLERKKGASTNIGGKVDEAFHTYGCWWVDSHTMKFYLDGKLVHTIEPDTDLDATPFDQPMFVNLVCEIYAWEVVPTVEDLMDESRNTTLYDYVRAYKLVKID